MTPTATTTGTAPLQRDLWGARARDRASLAMRTSGEEAVGQAALAAATPFRTAGGAYRIETEWRYVTARA